MADLYKDVYLPGVGHVVAQLGAYDDTAVWGANVPMILGDLENFAVRFGATTVEKRAGSGKYAKATFETEKSLEITAKAAALDMTQVRMTLGDKAWTTGLDARRMAFKEAQTVAAGAVTVDAGAYLTGKVAVELADGTALTLYTGTGTPGTGEFKETTPASGTLAFNTGNNGVAVYITYLYDYDADTNDDDLDIQAIGAASRGCPFALWYNHTYSDCDTVMLCEIFLYRVRPTGDFAMQFSHNDFCDLPEISMRGEDPGRNDQLLGYIFLKEAAA